MKPYNKKPDQKGFAALFITLLIVSVFLGIALSITLLTVGQQRIERNIAQSNKAYYLAEAGIEDAILRLSKNMKWSSPYILSSGGGTATVEISNLVGGSRTITSTGNIFNRVRKIQVVYAISIDKVSFYYGAQVGDGGMEMGNNSRVKGNVFSNGNVIGIAGKGYIDNTIIVARNGNRIEGLKVGQDASAHTCENSEITGDLTYVSGGSVVNCTAGGFIKNQPNEISPQPLPISESQINNWKTDALSGGILTSDYLLTKAVDFLGPIQIGTKAEPKNLTIDNGARLVVRGTIYVTGTITFDNNAIIELDVNSYGPTSGIIAGDGKIITRNNAILRGSGQEGSYILILSTSSSLDPANPAILIANNAEGAIFYANSGLISLLNGMRAREVTGYKVLINNNAEVEYESGLQNSSFSGGTGGSWIVESWREIE